MHMVRYLELGEVAEFLKLEFSTLKCWAKTNGGREFKKYCTKLGRRNVVLEENLDRWMKGLPPVSREDF
jgi:hypothetical protein